MGIALAIYPQSPVPSSISSPAILDPMWSFVTDSGIELRRSKHSRQRRRFTVEYTGKTDAELHAIRDFLHQRRLGMEAFEWAIPIYYTATSSTTTPVFLTMPHDWVTGQWVGIASPNTVLNQLWQITRYDGNAFWLNGSTATAAAPCTVFVYLPNAVGRFAEETLESATKLKGYWNRQASNAIWAFQVQIEETF